MSRSLIAAPGLPVFEFQNGLIADLLSPGTNMPTNHSSRYGTLPNSSAQEMVMNQATIDRLDAISQQLQDRALALSQSPSQEGQDHALMMSALATLTAAVRTLDDDVARLDGPKGIGAAGS